MDIQKIIELATQRGLSAINSIRNSITPQNIPNPVSPPIRQTINQFRTPAPSVPSLQTKAITPLKDFTLESRFLKPFNVAPKPEIQASLNIKPEIQQKINELQKPIFDRQAGVIASIPKRLSKTGGALAEFAKLGTAIRKKDINAIVPDLNKVLDGLETFSTFNDLFIQPFYDSGKLTLALAKGQKFDTKTQQSILRGEKPELIYLNDILGNTEQNTDPVVYNLIRFADFAPALIDIPLGPIGKTQKFAKEFKKLDNAGNFSPKLEKIILQKLAQFEQTIGRKLTPEETISIRKNIAKPTDIENAINRVDIPVKPLEPDYSIKKLTNFEKETLDTAKSAILSGEKIGGQEFITSSGVTRFDIDDVEKLMTREAELEELKAVLDNNIFERQNVEQFIPVINRGMKVYNLNKRKGIDDVATISNKVKGFDGAIQSLADNGYEVSSMEDLARRYSKYLQLKDQIKKEPNLIIQELLESKTKPVSKDVKDLGGSTGNTNDYIKELVKKQKDAKTAGKPGLLQTIKNIAREVDVKLQDFTTPINEVVNDAIKRGVKIAPTKNPIYQIDRVLRSNSIASQYVKDNGLASIIGKVDNLDEFNQYLIAKTAKELKILKPKIKTGRDYVKDDKLIKDLDLKYSDLARQIFDYNRKLLLDARGYGLISGDLYETLVKTRFEYVPIQRIFSEIENIENISGSKAVASIGKQSLVQKLEGSEREIANPLESMLDNTYKLVAQGEKNIAASQIAQLVKEKIIPGRILKKGEKYNSNEVISYLKNGEKEVVFVGKDIARAAKNLNKEASNFVINLLRIPTTILRVGAVGVNLPFVISNLVRDQQTALIVSGKLKNTIFNPVVFVKALFQSYFEGEVFDDFIRAGAGYSSVDILRNTEKTVRQLKDEAKPFVRAAKTIANPIELFKEIENFISKAETTTRLQVFDQTRKALIKQGRNPEDAEILAADAARNVTANFARRGEFGTVLNAIIPFFNATIQGSRTLRDAFIKNPARTTTLFALTVGMPTAASTLWNLSTPERKQVYDSIPEYEKERNIIIIPPIVTYDDRGYPFYYRLPKPQGFNQLADPIRKLMEKSYESIPEAGAKILNNFLGATTGYTIPFDEAGRRQFTSQFTPQILKPAIESSTGVNLFTGQRIIPRSLEKLPPQEQVKETTSITAVKLGKALNISPLMVENFIKTAGAGVGEQLINVSDRLQATLTPGIPKEQIGGRDPLESILNVFYRAQGGADVSKLYDQIEAIDSEKALLNLKIKDMILKKDIAGIKSLTPQISSQQFKALEKSVSEKEFIKTLSPQNRALFNYSSSQLESLKKANPDLIPAIDDVIKLKEQLKENEDIDTTTFEFKESTTPKKIQLKVTKPKKTKLTGRKKALPRPKKLKLSFKTPKIKKIKQKKFKPLKLKTKPKNFS